MDSGGLQTGALNRFCSHAEVPALNAGAPPPWPGLAVYRADRSPAVDVQGHFGQHTKPPSSQPLFS